MLNKLKQLKLKRWQLWILIIVALWMIYSGFTQLQREGKGPFGTDPVITLQLPSEETVDEQYI